MHHLPLDAPLRALIDTTGASLETLARAREPWVSSAAVGKALRGGPRIQLDTLAAYARALGFELVIGVRPIGGGEKSTGGAQKDLDNC